MNAREGLRTQRRLAGMGHEDHLNRKMKIFLRKNWTVKAMRQTQETSIEHLDTGCLLCAWGKARWRAAYLTDQPPAAPRSANHGVRITRSAEPSRKTKLLKFSLREHYENLLDDRMITPKANPTAATGRQTASLVENGKLQAMTSSTQYKDILWKRFKAIWPIKWQQFVKA